MRTTTTTTNERGIAMVATLLVMLLMSALMVGFTTVIMSDQRFRGIDRDRTQAFYAAHSGLERLTTDLGNLFTTNFAPSVAQLNALTASPPVIPGIQFRASTGGSGYTLTPHAPLSATIQSGPYQGLVALKTVYDLDATARTTTGGEVHLKRSLETVAIPVFQFGMFSDVDLSFHAGPNFSFGGRVHTNGNLFLANGIGNTLTLPDKVTAVREVIRQRLVNGVTIAVSGHTGTVSPATAPGAFRALVPTEGSVVDSVGSALNDPTWTNISLSTYNGYVRNGRTGARALNLPLITAGGSNPALVQRPAQNSNENVVNPDLFGQRFFSQVSLRILLSDTAADIQNLPTVTQGTQPMRLDWPCVPLSVPPVGYNGGVINATHPPMPCSVGNAATNTNSALPLAAPNATSINVVTTVGFQMPGQILVNGLPVVCTAALPTQFTGCAGIVATVNNRPVTTNYLTPANTPLIGGFIKIERQDQNQVWFDVTNEIMSYGIASRNLANPACADPNLNAILRLIRLVNNPVNCAENLSLAPTAYWPQVLYDTREGLVRDVALVPATNLTFGGVMHYAMLDVRNLSLWFQGAGVYAAGTGPQSRTVNGFSVYFSDRRNNRNAANLETGQYGWEDVINPAAAAGNPNGVLDAGEDVDANLLLDIYGNVRRNVPANPTGVFAANPTLGTLIPAGQAQVNNAIFFRRGLKLVNGGLGNIVAPGLTITAENPVYVQGDWNATQAGFGNPHVATSIIGDALTLLSNAWNDNNSFTSPYATAGRVRSAQSFYRFATIAGKNAPFPRPTAWASALDFGTDGGAHNFLHMLEEGGTVNYRGSIATFFYSRQATGVYKCCATVYGAPFRAFNFDTDFLTPALLPPLTPVFRDLNTLGFAQETRPDR